MKIILKTLKWILIVLLLVVVAAGVYLRFFFDANAYTPLIVNEVKKATGRELIIKNVKIDIFTTKPGIVLEGIVFSNASWGDKRPMVTADKAVVLVDLFALTDKKIRILKASLEGVDALIQINRDGEGNWVMGPEEQIAVKVEKTDAGAKKESAELDLSKVSFRVDNLSLDKIKVTFKDNSTGENIKKEISLDHLEASVSNASVQFKMLAKLMQDEIRADGLVMFSGDFKSIDVKDLNLAAFGSDISAKGTVKLGDKVDIRMDASSKKVDLNPFMPKETESETVLDDIAVVEDQNGAQNDRIFTDDPLPFGYLDQKIAADVSYRIESLLAKEYEVKDISTHVRFKDGRLEAPLKGKAGNGTLDMTAIAALQPNKKDAKLNIDLKMDIADLGTFAPKKYNVGGGETKLTATLESKGASTHAIASNMSGDILLDVAQVTAELDMEKLKRKQEFKVSCAVAHIELDKGIADMTRKIAFETDQGDLVSEGKIDLGDEWVDMGLRVGNSYHKKAALVDLFAGNIDIKGHFLNPKVSISTTSAIAGTARTLLQGQSVLQTEAMADENPCATARMKGKFQNKTGISKDGVVGTVKELITDPKNAKQTIKESGKTIEKNVKDILNIKKKK